MSHSIETGSDAKQVGGLGGLGCLALCAVGLIGCQPSSKGDGSAPVNTSGDLGVEPMTAFTADGSRGGPFNDSGVYTVRNEGDGDLFWSATPSEPWLSVSTPSGTLAPGDSQQLTVAVNATIADGLASGSYQGTIEFTDLASNDGPAVISASLDVQSSAGGGSLTVSPAEYATGGPKGGPFAPLSQMLTLRNPAAGSISWTATSDSPWLSLSQSSGTLVAGGQLQISATIQSPADALGVGSQLGKITFRDSAGGGLLADVQTTLGVGTTIEQQAWLNVHGKRFIPIGVWNQPPWSGQVSYLKGLGINTYLNNGLNPPEPTNPQLLDLLEANDMWAILQFDPAIKTHPRLLGWLLGDEPDLRNTPVATVQQDYDAMKAADPDHFIALNTMGNFYWDSNFGSPSVESLYQGYTGIADIASFDFYSVAGWHHPDWVYMPGAMVQFLLDRYLTPRKPVWAIIESSDLVQTDAFPGPTAAQMRFEVWDSLIHGATAIHYFTIAFDPFVWTNLTPTVEQELIRTNGQVTALTDVILSDPPTLQVTSSAASGFEHNFMLRQQGATTYLFVDNADMGYRSESISFSFPQAISSVSVYGEGRTITPSGATFTDSFAPLEVHIYEVRF